MQLWQADSTLATVALASHKDLLSFSVTKETRSDITPDPGGHRQERQKQRHNQNHQQTNNAKPKQPTNNTTNLYTKHPTHHTQQPALHPH